MAANTNPIFPLTPVCGCATLTTAATEKDGSTATSLLVAGENGTRVDKAICKPIATSVQTVVRFFITGTNLNNIVTEQTIAAVEASETEALDEYIIPLDLVLPAGSALKAAVGTTTGGLQVTVFGGDY